jgi:predicted TIM-barrel fold metal-dependent hydrolase
MRKIDIHSHVTTTSAIEDFQRLRHEIDKYDIDKSVVLASYFPHKGSGVGNYRLKDLLELENIVCGEERFLMFGSLDFENYFSQGFHELDSLTLRGKLSGIKIYTGYQEVDFASSGFHSLMAIASAFRLPVMFHTGYSFMARRSTGDPSFATMVGAKELEGVVDKYSDANFILSHLSKPFFEDMRELAKRYENVYTDMSGLIDSQHEFAELGNCALETKRFLDEVGPHKLLFGTDFPVQSHRDSVFIAEKALEGFNEDDQKLVYYDNAWRLLKLDETK